MDTCCQIQNSTELLRLSRDRHRQYTLMNNTISVFLFLLCFSIVRTQYYGYAQYTNAGCIASNLFEYVVYPTSDCVFEQNLDSYQQGSCGSGTITLYDNCTSAACSDCTVSAKTINACEADGSNSKKWLCWSTLPTPSAQYLTHLEYSGTNCVASQFSKAYVYAANKCISDLWINCTSSGYAIYSCQAGTNCGNCSQLLWSTAGICQNYDSYSLYDTCNSVAFPSPSPPPSPSRSPSRTPLPQSPSPTPASNPIYWGYALYDESGCQNQNFLGYSIYADNVCLPESYKENYFNISTGSCLGSTITIQSNCAFSGCATCTTEIRSVGYCENILGSFSVKWQCFNSLPQVSAESWYDQSVYFSSDCGGSLFSYHVAVAGNCRNTSVIACSGSDLTVYSCSPDSECSNCSQFFSFPSSCSVNAESSTSSSLGCHSVYDPSPSPTPSPSTTPVAMSPYWGWTSYESSTGCSSWSFYQAFTSNTCVQYSNKWIKGFCAGSQLFFYDNCTDNTCSSCSLHVESANTCERYQDNYIRWGCFAQTPTPSSDNYLVYETYAGPSCTGQLWYSSSIAMGCYNTSMYQCDQDNFNFYSCTSSSNCGACTLQFTIDNTCQYNDVQETSSKYTCHQTGGPSPQPSPSASPSFAPIQNAALWGYAQFYGSGCGGTPYNYVSYQKNQCVEDAYGSTVVRGSCSNDGTSITIYECDADCTNCVLSGVESVNSCENDGTISRKYSCWNTAPTPQTPYATIQTYAMNSSCEGAVLRTISQQLACSGGFKMACNGDNLVLSSCENSDCTGTCTESFSTNTTCLEGYNGWYSITTCYGDGSTTDGGSTATLIVANLFLVVAVFFGLSFN